MMTHLRGAVNAHVRAISLALNAHFVIWVLFQTSNLIKIKKNNFKNENVLKTKHIITTSENKSLVLNLTDEARPPQGAVDAERLKNYDQNWIDKLSELNGNHTIENNLDPAEAHRILQTLSEYSSGGVVTTCPVDKSRLIECYKTKKGDTLKCEAEVKEFVNCIDNLLYKATHIDERTAMSLACPKKMTYRERFEGTCLNK